ncbi:cytochrome P450 [Hyphomicrobium sp. MC1]|uniref:cytochrome P450 n=1 Tax=Hyphomicrobium sp. (strain MC1) TaxID=717785 RepID=UPI000213D591|nr:cytochrome P450 [Hyphomicrobium sp. MC1]CCB64372.1 Cytochrome P450 [Hyphomicrobium sp. MC1]
MTPALYPPTVTPPAQPLPLLPFLRRFIRNPLRAIPQAVYEEPVVTYGKKRPLLAWVTNPALIENILVKNAEQFPKTRLDLRVLRPIVGDGLLTAQNESWRWQRKIASPPFRHTELLTYVPTMVDAADECIAQWRQRGSAPFTTDVEAAMTDATFAVVARTVLAGINTAEGDRIKASSRSYLDPISWEVAASMLQYPETYWHPGKARMRRSADELRAIMRRLVAHRRSGGASGNDLVARMLAAKDPDTGEPMSDDMLADNLATFLFAGHETTAKALTWTLYLLARAPEWQDRLRDEISAVAGSAPITPETVTKLPTVSRVLKEAMRLYPPAPVMTRVTAVEMDIGGKTLPKSTLIVMPIFIIHRHRALWEDPNRFDPDRFLPEKEARYARTQFMPFGYGQRICIGSSFAILEATAILATLLRHARFEWDGKFAPEPVSRVTLRPKGGMPLTVRPL